VSTQKRIFSEAPATDPPIRFSVRAKMIALLTLALSVVFAAIFWWAYTFTTARTMERLRADLNSTLTGAVKMVDGDMLLALSKDGVRDPDGFSHDPRYLAQLDVLKQVHEIEPRAYAYSYLVAANGDCIYLVDVWVAIDKSKAAKFLEPDTGSEWTQKAFRESRLVERPDIYSDKWGRWLTSYAPIRNRAGAIVAVMGADFEADYVEQIQSEIRHSVVLVFGVSYLFALGLVYVAAGVFSRPIQLLTKAAEDLREESLGKDLRLPSRNDELGALARAFSRMSRRLGRAFHEIEQANQVLEERVQERTADLSREREKSESLLRNILPSDIADRLKSEPSKAIAEGFDSVTVLFADIVGFTELSARVSPLVLVNLLNEVFSAFDRLAEKHGVEKIKTIGDAYMVVGGLPVHREDHARAICNMALDMQDVMSELAKTHEGLGVRIGVHTGPVVAGVLGTKKFSYDLWGDSVNIASRMESHGERGKIQISDSVVEQVGNSEFEIEKRGAVKLKGRGEMTTYWLVKRLVDVRGSSA
jgi:class 3 adenylate cyclase